MAITDKTRKILWGRSGNRCAICRKELVMPSNELDDDVIIGDECHIVSNKPGGPRGDPSISNEFHDSLQNLILLCKIHHKVIDDQPNSYPVSGLKKLKARHEEWLKNNLEVDSKKGQKEISHFMPKIIQGKDLVTIVLDAHFYDFDYDEPENQEELDLISSFLQDAQDIGDLGSGMEAGGRVQIGFEMTTQIEELEKFNYWVFGIREQRNVKNAGQVSLWDFAVLRIWKKSNPLITTDKTLGTKPRD